MFLNLIFRSSNSDLLIFIVEAKRALDLLQPSNNNKNTINNLLKEELGAEFLENLRHSNTQVLSHTNTKDLSHSNTEDLRLLNIEHLRHSNGVEEKEAGIEESVDSIILLNKIDLLSDNDLRRVRELEKSVASVCGVSCVDGSGMTEFLEVFAEKVKNM